MKLLLGIDLGTSYFKVALFDAAGVLQGLGRVPVETQSPAPGHIELPVAVFWRTLRNGLRQALAEAQASPADIAGMSYASQANTFVLLDAAAAPLTPLISWTDMRAEPIAASLDAFSSTEEFARNAGFVGWSAGFAVAKWQWLQQHEPHLWSRVRQVMTVSDYFTYMLTGRKCGDASTAAFLGLYDLRNRRWWPDALSLARVEPEQLSQPLPPATPCGRTNVDAETHLGLPGGIPFAVGALDHHAAALGAGLGRIADVSISTGTVLAALALVDHVVPASGRFHGPHTDGKRYYRLAFDSAGAGQVEAYRRRFAPDLTIDALLEAAGGEPARGDHGSAVRALLTQAADVQRGLVAAVSGPAPVRAVTATGGGARSGSWLQIQADRLGVPVVTTDCAERACLGAALFGSVAAELYPSAGVAADAMVRESRRYPPGVRTPL